MKRFPNHLIGVDNGEVALFSDFETDGEMWTGAGPRERRQRVSFGQPYVNVPMVQVAISLWDVETTAPMRAQIAAEAIDQSGFEIVFRTWSDTRVARIRATWFAIGELPHADHWDIS